MEYILKFRKYYYIVIIFILLASALYHQVYAHETSSGVEEEQQEFWPCDWVPHLPPHFPTKEEDGWVGIEFGIL